MDIHNSLELGCSYSSISVINNGIKKLSRGEGMSSQEDSIIELESREYWWEQGEAVMREMTEEDDD